MFKGEAGESLKKINEGRNNTDNNQDIQVNEQNMNINNIKGRCIELIISDIESNNSDGNLFDSECVKYFVWEDEGVSYAIEYSSIFIGDRVMGASLSQEEIGKIAESLKQLNEIKNVDYTIDISK